VTTDRSVSSVRVVLRQVLVPMWILFVFLCSNILCYVLVTRADVMCRWNVYAVAKKLRAYTFNGTGYNHVMKFDVFVDEFCPDLFRTVVFF
jgi:hypothetical protein